MPTSFAQIRLPLLAAVLASGLAGCASTPPPTGELSSAQQAVMRADDADADQYAPQDLGAARRALSAAQSALSQGKDEDARRLALTAAAEADLAYARSKEALTNAELNQRRAEIAELRRRLSNGGGQ
ncbi:DUF4398 domain-containing protein [Pseudomonas sp. CGJS7]|uniref:DUF4398 domain-containing protein n=1 Tax=Pseudomonas sp. CGJS7 TaxID=3109348 RepID=UPI0030087D7E